MFERLFKLKRHVCVKGRPNGSEKKWNAIIDNAVSPISLDAVDEICSLITLDLSEHTYWNWLQQTDLPFRSLKYPHKKLLEFFFSIELLDIQPADHLLDAAGGHSTYLDAVQRTKGCSNLYLTDHIYTGSHKDPSGKVIVGGDISDIALANASLTKISCHHAFEHFQGHKDIAFIREIGRILKPGGRACIVPLFLVNRFTECWNINQHELFDEAAQLIVDKDASIPGADDDGHFARFYDSDAFRRRILDTAEDACLIPTIVTCRLDGNDLPDMDKNFGSRLNYPLRALYLKKS